jgi:hypothetical protein
MKVSKYLRDHFIKQIPELNMFPGNFCQELMLKGDLAYIGSFGDAPDHDLTESTIELF